MRAVRISEYGGPEVLRVEDVPTPTPGPGQVLLKVAACGINPLDAWFRCGHLAPRFPRPMPYTPGTDVVGVVSALGEGVSGVEVGATVMAVLPVLADGGYAEYTLADADRLAAVPDGLDPILAAAALTPGITGVQMAEKAESLGSCKRLLILGALGSVGRAATVTARGRGIEVLACVLPGQEEAVRELGIEHVFTNDDAAHPETLGGTIDVIIDLVGPEAVLPWERAMSPDGKVISAIPVAPAAFERKDLTTIPFAYSPTPESATAVATMLRDGALTIPGIDVLGLDETGTAHAVLPGNAKGRKFVVDPAK